LAEMWIITRADLSINHRTQRRYVQLNIEASISRAAIILVLTGTSAEIA
jgi:hypothetical protein